MQNRHLPSKLDAPIFVRCENQKNLITSSKNDHRGIPLLKTLKYSTVFVFWAEYDDWKEKNNHQIHFR